MTYELHPLCTLFPRLVGMEFLSLRDDIKANGLRQPIVLHGELILDGGNRYRACLEAGIEPAFEQFHGGSVVAFVLSQNLHRRHLSAGQQAAIVSSAQDWAKAQPHGGDRRSEQGATLHLARAQDRAAQSGASIRTQKMADKVAKADPALAKRVAHGEVSLLAAVKQVAAPAKLESDSTGLAQPKPTGNQSVLTPARPTTKETGVAAANEPSTTAPQQQPATDLDELRERFEEQGRLLRDALQDNQSMARVFEADDRLVAALAEAARFREQARVLQERVNGLIGEKNEAVRAAKAWKRKFEQLERAA
jgi:hypothetical protein